MRTKLKFTAALFAVVMLLTGFAVTAGAEDVFIDQDVKGTTLKSVTVVWQDIGERIKAQYGYQECTVDSYLLEWGESTLSTTGSIRLSGSARRYTITGLTPSSRYSVRVKWSGSYKNKYGDTYTRTDDSAYSMYVYTLPATVSSFKSYYFGRNHKGLEVVWTVPEGKNAYPKYEYQIVNTSGKVIKSGEATRSGLSLSSFGAYKQVTRLRVRGFYTFADSNTRIYGPWSGWKNLVPQPIMSTNTKKYGIQKNGTLKLAFSRVAGASSYTVYVAENSSFKGKKKVATVKQKSGATIKTTVKKYKGKQFKQLKHYYVMLVTNTKAYGKSGQVYYTDFWTYKVFR